MSSRPADPSDGPAVLVIEDQDDFRHALQARLEHEGYRTIGCSDALEALTTLQSGARVCLIVLDLKLPGLSGFQFREAQRRDPAIRDIPLVVMTGVSRPDDYDANLGAIAYLEKPVDTDQVLAFAREHCPCAAPTRASRRTRATVERADDSPESRVPDLFGTGREEGLASLIDMLDAGVVAIDARERIVLWNGGAERLYGWTAREAMGCRPDDLHRAAHAEGLSPSAAVAALRRGEPVAGEFTMRRKDGAVRWIELNARPLLDAGGRFAGYVSVHRDVTDRKEAERALRASEEQLRALVRASPLGIDIMDLEGIPIFYNAKCEELHGFTLDGAGPRGWIDALHPDDRARVVASWREAVREQREWAETYRFLHSDGRVVWVSGRAAAMVVDGRPFGFVGTLEDITALKEAEQALRDREAMLRRVGEEREVLLTREQEARREAEHAIRLRDEVLAIVAHDLRSPVNTITVSATLLARMVRNNDRHARVVEAIQRSARSMEHLIRDLLDVSRIEGGTFAIQPERVDVDALLHEMVGQFDPVAVAAGIQLTYDAGDVRFVKGDRERLAQVLSNLLSNAFKATPHGGRIHLRARRAGTHAEISVEDSGSGMPEEHLAHIFDRFWQAHRASRSGVGLGLVIVRGIVEAHGGSVGAESTPGRGTTFHFTLVPHDDPA